MYQYTYMLMAVLFAIFWLLLWFWRKDNRSEMFLVSTITGVCGPISEILYTRDWWSHPTITGTPIGIESVITGFMVGGIAAVAYENIFQKKIKIPFLLRCRKEKYLAAQLASIFLAMAVIFFTIYFLVGLSSLWATLIPMIIILVILYYNRPDLIADSVVSGIILVIVASIVYSTLSIITPGWIEAFWHFKNTPPLFFMGLPIDDVLWYLFGGAFIGPLYEFLQKAKIINL